MSAFFHSAPEKGEIWSIKYAFDLNTIVRHTFPHVYVHVRTNWPVLVVLYSSIYYWIKQIWNRFKLMFNVRLKICGNLIQIKICYIVLLLFILKYSLCNWRMCPFQGRNSQMCFKGSNEHSKEVSKEFLVFFLLSQNQ